MKTNHWSLLRGFIITLVFCFPFQVSVSGAPVFIFSLQAGLDYFSLPYPNDLHRYPDGRVDARGFPVPEWNAISAHYRDLADGRDGFGVTECAFLRFSAPLDRSRLPGLEESIAPDSSVFLVNVDKRSPAYGARTPVTTWFHQHQSGPLKNLLAVCPAPGFVLREETKYAVVVRRNLDPALTNSPLLLGLLSLSSKGELAKESKAPADLLLKAREIYRPLAEYLAEEKIRPEEIAAATVYTTGDPTRALRAIMAEIEKQPVAELDTPLAPYRDHPSFYALKGSFLAPQFQRGEGSQLVRGGQVDFDDQGRPVVQRLERVPIVVMVPKAKMPANGFPLVIYLHGGANTTDEFLDHLIKSKKDQFTPGEGPARTFAERGIAGVSSAIVKNPERYGRFGPRGRLAELPFYNFFRGDVLVANHWQAAADNAVLLRLMRKLTIDPKLCPQTDATQSPDGLIRFDPSLFFAMGFSMGGTILGVWSGVEPGIIATIPSGGSGHWGLLMRNFTSVPAKPYFFSWVTGGYPSEAMDERWPTLSIIQAALEPADTIVYAPHVFRRPFPGHPARHVYLAFGQNDFYTKAITQNALATALGTPLVGPALEPVFLPSQRLLGYAQPLSYPVRGNVKSEDGRTVTAAVVLYPPDSWTNDGHNVNYNLSETKHQYGCFLRTLVDTGLPTIFAPAPESAACE